MSKSRRNRYEYEFNDEFSENFNNQKFKKHKELQKKQKKLKNAIKTLNIEKLLHFDDE